MTIAINKQSTNSNGNQQKNHSNKTMNKNFSMRMRDIQNTEYSQLFYILVNNEQMSEMLYLQPNDLNLTTLKKIYKRRLMNWKRRIRTKGTEPQQTYSVVISGMEKSIIKNSSTIRKWDTDTAKE